MDPNELLTNTLALADHILTSGGNESLAEELAEHLTELNAWITSGGFLPQAWGKPDGS